MIAGKDIICISWLEWDSIPLIMHHMMKRLSAKNRVLFVDPPVAYSNLLITPKLYKSHFRKTSLWMKGIRRLSDVFCVYYPPPLMLQYGHFDIIDSINQSLTANSIKKVANKIGFKNPILWIYHPYAISPDGQFNEQCSVYSCNDDVGYFFTQNFNKRKKLSLLEEKLARKVDIVFAPSKNLFELRKSQNLDTHYLPSGIDLDLFKQALKDELSIPPDLKDIKNPIIGFIGGMTNAKMNWKWIEEAAVQHLDWSFVFIGPLAEPPPREITTKKNITFLASKDQCQLPAYIKGFDVCLIPYQGEGFLKACQPTKTYEYLSAGKPVVTSWINELEPMQNIVRLSRNAEEFIINIETSLETSKDPQMIHKYTQAVDGMTWDERVEEVLKLLEDKI